MNVVGGLGILSAGGAYVEIGPERAVMGRMDTDGRTIDDTIREMVRRIVERFRPERIILFGSHARGTAGVDSDVDLLAVLRDARPKRAKVVEIYRILAGIGLPKDVMIVTPEEIERNRDVCGTIIRPALREGRVLYERSA